MRHLIFILTIVFSLCGLANLSYAQEANTELTPGEQLILYHLQARMIDGEELVLDTSVTLENASESQLIRALGSAMNANIGNEALLTAITTAATTSPRITNKSQTVARSAYTILLTQARIQFQIARSKNVASSAIEPEVAARVIANIIKNSSIPLSQINAQLNGVVSIYQSLYGTNAVEATYYQAIIDNIGTAITNILNQETDLNLVCTTSNSVPTCVAA